MLLRAQVLICGGTGCLSSHSSEIKEEFVKCIKELGLDNEIQVIQTGCFGLCEKGPIVIVYPDQTFYSQVKVADVSKICSEHLLKGRIYEPKAYKEATAEEKAKIASEVASL